MDVGGEDGWCGMDGASGGSGLLSRVWLTGCGSILGCVDWVVVLIDLPGVMAVAPANS